MKALVLNTLGRGFDFEDVEIAAPLGRGYAALRDGSLNRVVVTSF